MFYEGNMVAVVENMKELEFFVCISKSERIKIIDYIEKILHRIFQNMKILIKQMEISAWNYEDGEQRLAPPL